MGTFIIGTVLLIIVVSVIVKLYKDKKSGVHICSGGCSGCQGCGHGAQSGCDAQEK